jgi:hypothetical protein
MVLAGAVMPHAGSDSADALQQKTALRHFFIEAIAFTFCKPPQPKEPTIGMPKFSPQDFFGDSHRSWADRSGCQRRSGLLFPISDPCLGLDCLTQLPLA